MFCRNCGSNLDDNAVVCPHCGVPTVNAQPPMPTYNQPPRTANGFAIAGFVLALVGLCGGNIILLIPGIVGLALSIVGIIKYKRHNSGLGLAIAGISVSAVSFIFWVYVWIVALSEVAEEMLPAVTYFLF